jgi:hypothetical protein
MSTRAWGAHSACGHPEPHGGCYSSCCLSKSKTKNKSKEDLEQEQLLLPDKLPVLNKEDWSLCMALLLFFFK